MDTQFEGWAMLELMGHRQRPGYVKEVEIAGSKMLRIDIPVGQDAAGQDRMVTEFYGPSAIYALRPCAEDVIREETRRYGADPRPVRPLEYREREKVAAISDQTDDERPF